MTDEPYRSCSHEAVGRMSRQLCSLRPRVLLKTSNSAREQHMLPVKGSRSALRHLRFVSDIVCKQRRSSEAVPYLHFGSSRSAIAISALPPKSGHVRCNEQCLLWAKSGHRAASFDHFVGASE